jgi:uncharacterized protein (DUF58 family)
MARQYRYFDAQSLGQLKNIALVARGVVEGFVTGLHKSPHHGFSVEFAEHRPYNPGDDPRYLDWKMLARTDRLTIKRFEDETNVKVHVLLDVSASMAFGTDAALTVDGRPATKLEYACYLCACLAYLMIRQQDAVGLVTFDHEVRSYLPPSSRPTQLRQVLETLEKIQPTRQTDIPRTFHDLANRFGRRNLVVILSDLLDEGDAIVKALHHFRHCKHEVILFHLFDPAELDFPFSKLTDFVDLETDERVQVDPRYAREQYLAEVEAFCDRMRKECAGTLVDYYRITTDAPLARMLMRFLALRGGNQRMGTRGG